MKSYHGSCHCGKVSFSVETEIKKVVHCNCSICSKKGVLHHQVSVGQFHLISGEDNLALYQFDSKDAKHFFCKTCGVHSFCNPRSAPEKVSINIRCLDDFDLEYENFEIIDFDGRHWSQSIKQLKQQLNPTR